VLNYIFAQLYLIYLTQDLLQYDKTLCQFLQLTMN